jgi:tRNA threonylcarbamoyladenosine biosynthesis protein TsaB
MEVYTGFFDAEGKQLSDVKAEIIDEQSFGKELNEGKVVFLGNGAFKCKEKIRHPNAVYVEDFYTSAKNMASLAEQAVQQKRFEDVAYFEPFYLKDFVATIPRNKIIPKQGRTNQSKE